MESYYVITSSEDGDITIQEMSKEGVLSLAEENNVFSSHIENYDPMYWGAKTLVIKGKIVTPTAKVTVKEFDIE